MGTDEEVAIKLEPANTRVPQLLYEAKVMKTLGRVAAVPDIHWCGSEGDYNVMVMDLLGPSLEDLFKICNRKFSLKTVLSLADQMISGIEAVHAFNFLHRDIKPDNFTMGLGVRSNLVHIIDFGLSKKYRHSNKTTQHIEYRTDKSFVGTAR